MMRNKKNILAALLALAMALSVTACANAPGTVPAGHTETAIVVNHGAKSAKSPSPTKKPAESDSSDSAEKPAVQEREAGHSVSSWSERYERIWGKKSQANKKADAADTADSIGSVEAIAVLGSLTGTGQQNSYEWHDMVDTSDSHNPYDLVWEYGDRDTEGRTGFGSLYRSYVDAVDWSLVFDVEYYKQAFPMLAMLYHDDDGLLLEHFQTVGVHEGRQGCEGFNVAAYMSVCDSSLLDAFDDAYECYYFYYMLNHDAEQNLDTASAYGENPLWLGLELTQAQRHELTSANWYREDAGTDPLELHPETIAFANYRAWYNAVNCLAGHSWLDSDDNTDPVFDALGVDHISENTVTGGRGQPQI